MFHVSVARCCSHLSSEEFLLPSSRSGLDEVLEAEQRVDRPAQDDDDSILEAPIIKKMMPSADNSKQRVLIDPYHILQVRRDATPSEIRHAYKRLSLWHHPGRCLKVSLQERARRKHVFEILAACFETLMDKEARCRCDTLLKEMDSARDNISVASQTSLPKDQPIASQEESEGARGRSTIPPLSPASTNSENSCSTTNSADEGEDDIASDLGKSPRQSSVEPSPALETQQSRVEDQPISVLICGSPNCLAGDVDDKTPSPNVPPNIASMVVPSSSSTLEPADIIHYSEKETSRLFGGPLQLLYRARRFKPFQDPMQVFQQVFGQVDLGQFDSHDTEQQQQIQPHYSQNTGEPNPAAARHSAWSGSSEKLKDGTVVLTTTRTLHDRVLIRTEIIRPDRKQSQITVTSEPLVSPTSVVKSNETCYSEDAECSQFTFCFVLDSEETHALSAGDSPWSACQACLWQ